jgi:hypothetical protein
LPGSRQLSHVPQKLKGLANGKLLPLGKVVGIAADRGTGLSRHHALGRIQSSGTGFFTSVAESSN